jgi:PAS domain S-box-containing protein
MPRIAADDTRCARSVAGLRIPRLLVFSLAVWVTPGILAQTAVEAPRTIRVAMDNAYAPYAFESDDGTLQGILIDQWRAWERKTGIRVEIHGMDWGDALRRMRAGEFDVIDSIVATAERRGYFDFTPAYATIEARIYFRRDISGLTDLASLKGFPVGVKTGDQHIDRLTANGVTTVIPFPSNDAIIEAATQRKINVFVADAPSALYLLNKAGIEGDFRQSAPIFRDQLRRAVRKGDAALLRTVSNGFAALDPGELKGIEEKWFGRAINGIGRYLAYAAYGTAAAIGLIACLAAWNRTLRKAILQRTAALSESERRFRQIAENIREVFWVLDVVENRFTFVSPMYEEVFGKSCASLYADSRSFLEVIHPDDRARIEAAAERALAGRQVDERYRVLRPDGSMRWVRARTFPVPEPTGPIRHMVGVGEDITEAHRQLEGVQLAEAALRESEERFATAFRSTPNISTIATLTDGRFLDVNAAFVQMFEYERDEAIGQTALGLGLYADPRRRPSVMDLLDGGAVHNIEVQGRTKSGRILDLLVSMERIEIRGEACVLTSASDISDQKIAERRLDASVSQLRALANRLLHAQDEERRRIAQMLHETTAQDLAGLKMILAQLNRTADHLSDSQRGALTESMSLAEQAMTQIRTLSYLLHPPFLDEAGLLSALRWYAAGFAERSGIKVDLELPENLERLPLDTETALFRVVQESLTNIHRHAESGTARIRLRRDVEALVLEIEDRGHGIPKASLKRITSRGGVSGVGVAGMSERIEQLGGSLELTSSEQGTSVRVWLPLERFATRPESRLWR